MTKKTNDNMDQEKAELLADLQRTRADFENYRKNSLAQEARNIQLSEQKMISKLLPIIDDIDRATRSMPDKLDATFDKWREGFAKLPDGINKALAGLNIKKINSEVGELFDPEKHEAVAFDESADADSEGAEVVAEPLQNGYEYNGRVVRPAIVKVKRG
jgi:molecular chaperone GrpE